MNQQDYSQYGEQAHILNYFQGRVGRLLDIGAYDGLRFSNSRALLELGWGGVMVEPDPCSFAAMIENCRDFGDVVLVNAALAERPGLLPFYSCGGEALSSSSEEHVEFWRKAWPCAFTEIEVVGVTAKQLLSDHPGPYEFVNLDVEGMNWELLQTLPLRATGTRLICVEHQNKHEQMLPWLADQGLTRMVHFNGDNMLVGT